MANNSEFLYRIIRWEHLVDLFHNKRLFFARPSAWDDPYELRIDHPALSEVFAQCWCRRGVSDAMWRIYSPSHYGVRIKVRRSELVNQLNAAKKIVPFRYRRIGSVKYRRQSVIDMEHKKLVAELESKYDAKKGLDSLMFKRNAFNHEAETRVLIHAPKVSAKELGVSVPVNPHVLVETILADPRMPEAVFKAFEHYVKTSIKFKGKFRKSTIYSASEPHRVGYDDET
ncbi:DUF2971 domain-containing protein [Pseudoalteromonas phenolica]|uniref:DUF2971 domain-containing protein n=1 Tax=Pseudoalteromonas phenolica TaxID=161398 RepID=UPI00110B1B10|nr:DUF2971 domain-containing protein [Pseudoalteromonas phenolica]TMO57121.1 hypothetical protein CWC21_04340 [Pseudoalteromonas phenolica]